MKMITILFYKKGNKKVVFKPKTKLTDEQANRIISKLSPEKQIYTKKKMILESELYGSWGFHQAQIMGTQRDFIETVNQ